MELVHGGGGVGHGAHLIGVELLPPVQGGGDVQGHEDLPEEFPVVAARSAQAQLARKPSASGAAGTILVPLNLEIGRAHV